MGDVEYGKCEMCGREADLQRRYYEFNVKCECHSPRHFELVKYCSDCIPIMPTETTIEIYNHVDDKVKKITIDTETLKLITNDRTF